MEIRSETMNDHEAIRAITVAAFANSEFGHNGESDLIDVLRATSVRQLSLVACLNSEVVGHVLFTPVTIRTSRQELQGMGLAPISVAPQHQKTGVGSSLITDGLGRLFADDCPFVVVLGHPEFYLRFGFHPASQFDISHGFAGLGQDAFFIQGIPNGSLTQVSGGQAFYRPEFGPQHDGA